VSQLQRLFTEHPASVGETWLQHCCSACRFSMLMLAGGFICAVHALLPFLFRTTGSDIIRRLHHDMVGHRSRLEAQDGACDYHRAERSGRGPGSIPSTASFGNR